MKKYIIHIISLALLTFFYGCSQEDIQATMKPGNSRTLTLTLTHAGMESRATSAGVEKLNENLINRVDLFLYPKDGTGSDAVFSRTGINTFTSKEDGRVVINLDVPMAAVEKLFPEGVTTCEAYVIVNRPTKSAIPTNTDMASLKAISITSELGANKAQDEFVMDGHSMNITYANNAISGSIAAERSAAKITLTITEIEKDLTDEGGTTWTPLPGQMQVMFYNGVKTSQVNTASVPADGVYFNLVGENGRGFTNSEVEVEVNGVKETQTHYNHAIPFYSYPSDWGKKTPDKEAHMVLMLPWEANNQQTNFYYEVPIDDINKKLVRNTYYQIELVVGVLGSTELNDEIVKLTPTCILLNWGEEQINADLDQPRYLVAEDVIKIYNQNSVNIPFESSHDVTITSKSCYKPNLNPKSGESDETPVEVTDDNLDVSGRTISYNRTLDNNFTSGTFDFTPYYTTFTITQTGNTGKELSKEITIIQYPAIFGEKEVNSDYENNSSHHGFTFVNGYYGSGTGREDGQDYFDNVIGAPSSSVSSNAMLVFTVTTTEGTNYVIGDPRETSYTFNKDDAVWATANAIYDGNSDRELNYYYGTETAHNALKNASISTRTQTAIYPNDAAAAAAERTYNMIAPKFRISSGYGAIDTDGERQYYDLMKKRCASYQEDGYPAGRWRLPTKAELEFIFYLSNTGKVPQLFVSYMDYWCAHGYATPGDNGYAEMGYKTNYGSSDYISVRCVYDDWYWGSEPVLKTVDEKNIFTWGDIPRGQ